MERSTKVSSGWMALTASTTPSRCRIPPFSLEASTSGISRRSAVGKCRPRTSGCEPGHVGQRHHLDRVLGAVQERPEHLRVVVLAGEAVHARHVVRVHLAEALREARALAGGHQAEAERARPVAELGGQRRLVAVGQAVDHARGLGELAQVVAYQHVGLDRYHGQVLAGQDRAVGVAHRHLDQPGRLDDDVDGAVDQGPGIGGDHRRAGGHGLRDLIGGGGAQRFAVRPRAQHRGGRLHAQVGDRSPAACPACAGSGPRSGRRRCRCRSARS